jgi:hypothetical protein
MGKATFVIKTSEILSDSVERPVFGIYFGLSFNIQHASICQYIEEEQ